ncbi:hypothetical protein ZIOFF_075976 [Zingiber officinale]|uniref:Uncharacterized protein n=1 Tax=Zingiber officinale TaxID=94328 RepID=A0A8J5EKI3_ZINOF|nr:hypothetical protein ZIOFF_075976 [Zingiber officinale]
MNSQAIILSKPGANASREDIKFYIKDLLLRLRIGDLIMRIQTLVTLKEIPVKDEKDVLIMKSDNGWSVSAHRGITTLLKICVHPNNSKELVVLDCQILKNLSSVEEMRRFIVEGGAILVLSKLSKSIEESHQIQKIELLQDSASGFMPQLVRLTGAKSSEIREKSAEIEEEHNVNQIMRCLAFGDKLVTKNHLLSILKAMAESSSGRRKIMVSGCV